MTDVPPSILWPVAIIGGGGIAGLTKGSTALVRAKSGLMTGGLANPVVSTAETVGATGLSLFAIALPVVCARTGRGAADLGDAQGGRLFAGRSWRARSRTRAES